MHLLSFALLAVAAASVATRADALRAAPADHSSSVCQATSCGGCVAISYGALGSNQLGCGWCKNVGQCVLGQASGPIDPLAGCVNASYAWGVCETPAPTPEPAATPSPTGVLTCDHFNANCHDCVKHKASRGGGCGWCQASNTCEFGTSQGPMQGSCGSGWDWTSSTCTGPAPTPLPPSTETPAPTNAFPPPAAVNASARTWSGYGGDNYNTFYVDEEAGPNVLMAQQWGLPANGRVSRIARWRGGAWLRLAQYRQ